MNARREAPAAPLDELVVAVLVRGAATPAIAASILRAAFAHERDRVLAEVQAGAARRPA